MDTLKAILLELGIEESDVTETALLRKDLQLDSTETVQIALELKRRLGVNVKLEARQDMTLGHICDLVVQAMALNPA
ncbi:acyl carrier protein [Phormidesmis priestleyi ULC007]|uniref:Acyl carrier protein n=2 Tax=Phormidesmis priestleyi TaxID=268141 RepID=A0A2T1DN64_9CYAN|nr:acyl carrier protein [Phormidesmis priestleyi ULC007]PZO55098.1 MAG: acyl carrier protein [Phormidesmis priestleyi]